MHGNKAWSHDNAVFWRNLIGRSRTALKRRVKIIWVIWIKSREDTIPSKYYFTDLDISLKGIPMSKFNSE